MNRLTRFDSYQEAEGLWQEVLFSSAVNTLFVTPLWQKVWWQQFGHEWEMLLLCINGDKGVDGIAPLARRNGAIGFIGGQDLFDYADFLVSLGAESRFYACLLDYLDGEDWEYLEFFSLAQKSPTLEYLPHAATKHGYSVEVHEEGVTPGLILPHSWDAYVQALSKKDRHELRRKLRRLSTAGEEFVWRKYSEPSDIASLIEEFILLMRYGNEAKHRFLTEPREQFFRSIAMELAGTGILKLFFLEQAARRVAAAMCFDYGPSRLLYNSGFDPNYSYYSVGLVLKAFCIKDAIEEGKEYFDFLRGSESYKYDLGGKDRTLYRMVVKRS